MSEYVSRQYRPAQKKEFLKAFLPESRAAADLLGDDTKSMTFGFATGDHGAVFATTAAPKASAEVPSA